MRAHRPTLLHLSLPRLLLLALLTLCFAQGKAQVLFDEGHTWDFTNGWEKNWTGADQPADFDGKIPASYKTTLSNTYLGQYDKILTGFLFSGSPRFQPNVNGNGWIQLLNTGAEIKFPVLKGQKATFTIKNNQVTNKSCKYTIQNVNSSGTVVSETSSSIAANTGSTTLSAFEAKADGYILMRVTENNRLEVQKIVLTATTTEKNNDFSHNYESYSSDADAETYWSIYENNGKNIITTLVTGDATYGKYGKYVTANVSRNPTGAMTWGDPFNGKSTPKLYFVEFDAQIYVGNASNNGESRSNSQLALLGGTAPTLGSNAATNDVMFQVFNGMYNTDTWYINSREAGDGVATADLNRNNWYHYRIAVTGESVQYKISQGNNLLYSGFQNVTTSNGNKAVGLFYQSGRGNGRLQLDNIKIWHYQPEAFIEFATHSATAELIDIDFAEPALSKYPETATVTYKSSNTKIAEVDANGDVRFLNGGIVTITATLDGYTDDSGNPISDSYTVTVSVDDAQYEINEDGNKYTFVGKGKLAERRVEMIPGITMEFGNANNTNVTIVRPETVDGTERLVATTFCADGWRNMEPVKKYSELAAGEKIQPNEGSFYKFTAKVAGTLTVWGAKSVSKTNGKTNTVVAVDNTFSPITGGNPMIEEAENGFVARSLTLEAGKTYYIYGNTPETDGNNDDKWTTYQLNAFQFIPDFRFEHKSVILRGGWNESTSYRQQVLGSSNVKYEIERISSDLQASIKADGTVYNLSGRGGALIVKATDNATGLVARYVLTVPVQLSEAQPEYTWDFRSSITKDDMSGLKGNTEDSWDDWGVTYKVRSYDATTRMLYYLNESVLCNNKGVSDDNFWWISETGGITVKSGSKGFGTVAAAKDANTPLVVFNQKVSNGEYTEGTAEYTAALDEALKEMLNFSTEQLRTPKWVTTGQGTIVTIPELKKGQYVKLHWGRHSGGAGEFIKVTNLKDLDGREIGTVGITNVRSENATTPNYNGSFIFQVVADGDVTFMVNDPKGNGWMNIYDITISQGYWTNDMRLFDVAANQHIYDEITSGQGILFYPGETTKTLEFRAGSNYANNARTTREEFIAECEGTVTASVSVADATGSHAQYNVTMTVNRGTGNIKLIQKVYDTTAEKYLVDMEETYFAVGEVDQQPYPYTWDFTDYNMGKSPAGSKYNTKGEAEANVYGHWKKPAAEATATTLLTNTAVVPDFGNIDKTKPLFSVGAQLTKGASDGGSGNPAIEETKGLGVGYSNGMAAIGSTDIQLNGEALLIKKTAEGNPQLTIPGVKNGQYVYVVADVAPEVTVESGSSVQQATDMDGENSKYGYRISSSSSSGTLVTLTFNIGTGESVAIRRIGVTDILKDINKYGYATESRDVAIDHTYEGIFTKNDVNAYIIKQEDYNTDDWRYEVETFDNTMISGVVTLSQANVIAEQTGIILYKDETSEAFQSPLFVPACNVECDNTDNNLLKPNVNENSAFKGTTSDGKTNYILTNIAYYTKGANTGQQATQDRVEDIGFYRSDDGTLGANKSYLQLGGGSSAAKPIVMIWRMGSRGTEDTAVRQVVAGGEGSFADEQHAVYYNLNGLRLSGRPSKGGLYIRNGKKIVIK